MNPYLTIPLLAFLVNGFIWTYALAQKRESPVNRAFLIYAGSISIWILFNLVLWSPVDPAFLLPLLRIDSVVWLSIGFWFLHFTYRLLARPEDLAHTFFLVSMLCGAAAGVSTDWVIRGVAVYPWGAWQKPGFLFVPLYFLVGFLPIAYGLLLIGRRRRHTADGRSRKQLNLLFYGVILSLVLITIAEILIPDVLGCHDSVRLSASLTVVQSVFIFLAMTRYRFLTITSGDVASNLFANIQDGVVLFDTQGRAVQMNDAGRRLLDLREAEVAGCTLSGLLPDNGPASPEQTLEARIPWKGRELFLAITRARIRQDGEDAGSIVILKDIGEKKRIENAMREAWKRFHDLAMCSGDWVWEVGADGRYTFADGNTEAILGYKPKELLGRSPFSMMPREEAARVQELFRETAAQGRPLADMENWNLTRDGRRICVLTNGVPILDERGRPAGYRGVDKDITARKQAEEKLVAAIREAEAANRAKSEFLANMSHEIRTPMNGVIGMTGLLLDTNLDLEQREYAETIRSSGESLLTIINDILDFSKIEAGKLQLEEIDFDLRTVLEEVSDLTALRAFEKGLEFGCVAHHAIPSLLRGDPGRLRQILLNLLHNAVKFTERGDVVVQVTLEEENEAEAVLRFAVTDTGIGIAPERFDRLFRSFSQVDGSTSRRYGGTGLGLSISKQLVERMHGRIGAESEPGKGSTFWFTVRLAKQPGARAGDPVPLGDIQGKRVLIVDDNSVNRDILRELLRRWRCRPEECRDGPSALARLRSAREEGDPFEIAVIDMQMPDMDGETLGRRIKQDPLLAGTALIMLTSIGLRGDPERMREIGFSAYLTKPVKQSSLHDCLAVVTGLRTRPGAEQAPCFVTRHLLAAAPRQGTRILLAEDDITNQKVALHLLRRMGCAADAVANGEEAVRALEMVPYELVLMDVQMPEVDGLEATARIRASADPRVARTPVVAMTAHAMQGDRERCLRAGMNDYTPKPIDPQDLQRKVERWLGGARQGVRPPADTEPPAAEPA